MCGCLVYGCYGGIEMKILHYTVGLNENRGGGLTKYVDDLAKSQIRDNNVMLLYPGEYNILNKEVKIKREKNKGKMAIFSIINPLSLPMLFGLKDEDYLERKTSKSLWETFLKDNKIDIIHLHTLMGLYEEFIDAANELGIPMVYTTHDYFGLCTKQTFIYNNKICEHWDSCEDCPKCNIHAFSKKKTFIIHSKLFCELRKNKLFLIIKSHAKSKIEHTDDAPVNEETFDISYYKELKSKYYRIFSKIDWFHFNSSISKYVFHRELPLINGEIINITHRDISDHRKEKAFDLEKLQITYLGPATAAKGFERLIYALDKIYKRDASFVLNIFTDSAIERKYIHKCGDRYEYSQLESIMDKTDILVAPSVWYETFGFTVREALSYGVPVLVSDTLGAKDIVRDGENGYITNEENLSETLMNIVSHKEQLKQLNHTILLDHFETFDEHCDKIIQMYKNLCDRKNRVTVE